MVPAFNKNVGQLSVADETTAASQKATDQSVTATASFAGAAATVATEAPTSIGRYRIERLLGQGTFGRVWLAIDEELQRPVAIKIPSVLPRKADEGGDQFLVEARTLAALDHPHIVPVYDVGRTERGSLYVVSKFIEGSTLASRLARGRLPWDEIGRLIAPLCDALTHAHAKGIVHRDVKPANILLEEKTGRVYLADFGLAVLHSQAAGDDQIAGTPAYMSPEQARAEAAIDPRSDIFSLGIVLYELLAGERPFQAQSASAVIREVINAKPRRLRDIDPTIPKALEEICKRAMAAEPASRYATAAEMATELRSWLEEHEAAQRKAPSNLPGTTTSLIGRDEDIERIRQQLTTARLVTLTGPGGVGKTRLAVEVAQTLLTTFPDGVFLVELAPVADAALVPSAIAQAVGVRESAGQSIVRSLCENVSGKRMLLVLDNFEHLLTSRDDVRQLLEHCPNLHALVTSRAPLHLAGEYEYPVPLLGLPGRDASAQALASVPAVALFVERARQSQPAFKLDASNAAAVAEICTRLDGLPLAIELAAARIKVFSAPSLLERLKAGLSLLSSRNAGAPGRQQTLRSAVEWSYDLLAEEEQQLFARLAVFSGGATLEAISQVCPAEEENIDLVDGLTSLVENSLLRTTTHGDETRFVMLETMRDFARERLAASGAMNLLSLRHAEWIERLSQWAAEEMKSPNSNPCYDLLEREHPNIRAALTWCLNRSGDRQAGDLGLSIGGHLWRFWAMRGYIQEGRKFLDDLLATFGGERNDAVLAKAHYAAGCLKEDLAEYAAAREHYLVAQRIWQEAGDPSDLANAYVAFGSLASSQADYDAAEENYSKALAIWREQGERRGVAVALSNLGTVEWARGNYDRSQAYHEESLAIRRELGSLQGVAISLTSLGLLAARRGDFQAAWLLYSESLELLRAQDNKSGIAVLLNNLGDTACELGDYEKAEQLSFEALRLQQELGDRYSIAFTLETLGSLCVKQESFDAAVHFFAVSDAMRQEMGAPVPPGEQASRQELIDRARQALGRERFDALWTAGRVLSVEKLIERYSGRIPKPVVH